MIAKHRFGCERQVSLCFRREYMKFDNPEEVRIHSNPDEKTLLGKVPF